MHTTIEYIDPQDLVLHPERKKLPDWDKEDPAYHAMVEGARARGTIPPLVCIKPNFVLIGAGHWHAAKALQFTTVPVIWASADAPANRLLEHLLERKHFSKGALAYLAVLVLDQALRETVPLLTENSKKLQQKQQNSHCALSAQPARFLAKTEEELADSYGLCRRLISQAKEVRDKFKEFSKDKFAWDDGSGAPVQLLTLKEYFEPKILASLDEKPLGLGAVIAGIASKRANTDRPQREQKQLNLFTEGFGTLVNRFSYWTGFDKETRAKAMEEIREQVQPLPFEQARELAAWFSAMAKTIRRSANEEAKKKAGAVAKKGKAA